MMTMKQTAKKMLKGMGAMAKNVIAKPKMAMPPKELGKSLKAEAQRKAKQNPNIKFR